MRRTLEVETVSEIQSLRLWSFFFKDHLSQHHPLRLNSSGSDSSLPHTGNPSTNCIQIWIQRCPAEWTLQQSQSLNAWRSSDFLWAERVSGFLATESKARKERWSWQRFWFQTSSGSPSQLYCFPAVWAWANSSTTLSFHSSFMKLGRIYFDRTDAKIKWDYVCEVRNTE